MDEYSLYDLPEDGSYYDDDYDDCDDCDYEYYATRGWRYRWNNFRYRLKWFVWRQFKHCNQCGKRNKNCGCIPF